MKGHQNYHQAPRILLRLNPPWYKIGFQAKQSKYLMIKHKQNLTYQIIKGFKNATWRGIKPITRPLEIYRVWPPAPPFLKSCTVALHYILSGVSTIFKGVKYFKICFWLKKENILLISKYAITYVWYDEKWILVYYSFKQFHFIRYLHSDN